MLTFHSGVGFARKGSIEKVSGVATGVPNDGSSMPAEWKKGKKRFT